MNRANSVQTRREFLQGTTATLALASCGAWAADSAKPLAAAVIGHTGRGDYGHGLDKIFTGRNNVKLIALADPDEAGRKKIAAGLGPVRVYSSHRELLEKEK